MTYIMLKVIMVAVIILSVGLVGMSSFQIVDAGKIGVLKTWGEVSMDPQAEGLHWVIPVAQNITPMSIQIQKYESTTDSASKDLQTVMTEVTVNYHPLPDKVPFIFQQIGALYEDRIINPAIEETIKQVTAQFNAEELITKRPLVKQLIEEAITDRLAINDIMVDHISITEFTFSKLFTNAIEAKVEAEQKAQKATNDLVRIEVEAQQKIAEANGLAESKKLIGDAEAYALNAVGEALRNNPDLLTMENIKQWDGVLPYFLSNGDGEESPTILLAVSPPERQQ